MSTYDFGIYTANRKTAEITNRYEWLVRRAQLLRMDLDGSSPMDPNNKSGIPAALLNSDPMYKVTRGVGDWIDAQAAINQLEGVERYLEHIAHNVLEKSGDNAYDTAEADAVWHEQGNAARATLLAEMLRTVLREATSWNDAVRNMEETAKIKATRRINSYMAGVSEYELSDSMAAMDLLEGIARREAIREEEFNAMPSHIDLRFEAATAVGSGFSGGPCWVARVVRRDGFAFGVFKTFGSSVMEARTLVKAWRTELGEKFDKLAIKQYAKNDFNNTVEKTL